MKSDFDTEWVKRDIESFQRADRRTIRWFLGSLLVVALIALGVIGWLCSERDKPSRSGERHMPGDMRVSHVLAAPSPPR